MGAERQMSVGSVSKLQPVRNGGIPLQSSLSLWRVLRYSHPFSTHYNHDHN